MMYDVRQTNGFIPRRVMKQVYSRIVSINRLVFPFNDLTDRTLSLSISSHYKDERIQPSTLCQSVMHALAGWTMTLLS